MTFFVYSLLINLPLWILSLLLVLAPVKNRMRFSRPRTYGIALGAVTLACILSALWDQFIELDGNIIMLPILLFFFFVYCRIVRGKMAQKAFILLTGAVFAAFSVLLSDVISQAFFRDLGDWPDYLWGIASDILVVLVLLPLFSGRIRWMAEQNDDARVWRTLWVIPFVFLALSIAFYITVGNIGDPFLLTTYGVSVALLIVLLIVIYNSIFRTVQEISENACLRQNMQLADLQAEQYASLRRHMAETAQARHDFRHQLLVIRSLADRESTEELRRYLDQYVEGLSADRPPLASNYAVDAVAKHYLERAEKADVKIDFSLRLPERLGLPEGEFCMVFANLLENALEACQRMPDGPRFISVDAEQAGNFLVVVVENSFDESTIRHQGCRLLSSKRGGRGLGLSSVAATTEKYHGELRLSQENGVFRAEAALCLPREESAI